MSATVHTAIRIRREDLDEITRRARARGISRTSMLIDSALERLPETESDLQAQVDELQRKVERIENMLYAGA